MRTHLQLVALILFALAVCLTGCCWSPGTAHAGYSAARPVIAALEKFHHDHGQYPETLEELVHQYLADRRDLLWQGRVQPLNAPGQNHTVEAHYLQYYRHGDDYTLGFSYSTWSMNRVAYDSRTREWSKSGYF